jgi:hypothetical protein
MKRIMGVVCILILLLSVSSVLAADNVVVVPLGSSGLKDYEQVKQTVTLGAVGSVDDLYMTCPAGKRVLSGGQASGDGLKRLDVWRSGPTGTSNNQWLFTYTVLTGGSGRSVYFSVICAK